MTFELLPESTLCPSLSLSFTIFIFICNIFIFVCNIFQDTGRRRWRRAGSSPYWSPSQRESCSSSARSLIAVYRGITKELHCFTYKQFIFYSADHHPLHRPGAGAHQADRPEPPAVRWHLVLAALRRAASYIRPLRRHQLLKGDGSRHNRQRSYAIKLETNLRQF